MFSCSSSLFRGLILIRTKPSCSSVNLLCPVQNSFVRWVKTSSVTIEFLVNSCGLSPESALSAAKKVSFKSHERPEAVVRFLQGQGLGSAQISKLVRKRPTLLLYDPDKTLKPKIDFFKGLGMPTSDLAQMLSAAPALLQPSLKNHLIPWAHFLRTLLGNDGLVRALRGWPFILTGTNPKSLARNMEILQGHGLPVEKVAKMIIRAPRMLISSSQKLNETAGKVVDMGFSPLRFAFFHALRVLIAKSKWEEMLEVYKSVSWSDEQILLAFKKQPQIFLMSVKKIKRMMGFFVDKMGCGPSVISECPYLMLHSLEKRIMPRYCVLEMLMEKGLIKHDWALYTVMQMTDTKFLAAFVAKYQHEAPQLLKLYQQVHENKWHVHE